ncbi:MAG: hypothetical protein HZB57_01475 [Gammaproteobacteria bacterium]|nr:hypothetical protein [Gammaproteobacteria bacterium]
MGELSNRHPARHGVLRGHGPRGFGSFSWRHENDRAGQWFQLKRTFDATPDPKQVLAMGDCGADGGEFGCSYASCGGVSKVIPVDGVVRGCPPTPLELTPWR